MIEPKTYMPKFGQPPNPYGSDEQPWKGGTSPSRPSTPTRTDRGAASPSGLGVRDPGAAIAECKAVVTNFGRLVLGSTEADVYK